MAIRPKSIVPIIGEPDIDESYIRQQDAVVLETLLIDRTMTALNGGSTVNIKWAVDDYAKEYPNRTGYGCEEQITIDAISSGDGKDLKVVTPRVKKRKEEQERRTAQKAEVFTPSWICNEQNNLVDVLLARENMLYAVIEYYCDVFKGEKFPPEAARRFAEIISWNIWQMDGIKFVVPNTCGKKKDMLGSSIECAGCAKNDVKLHDGVRCRVMDWEIGKPVLFMPPFEFKTIEG